MWLRIPADSLPDRLFAYRELIELAPPHVFVDCSDGWTRLWLTPAIVISPAYAFGMPTISGARVDVIVERYRGGDSPEFIAEDLDIHPDDVQRALIFAQGLW